MRGATAAAGTVTATGPEAHGVHAHRVIFIDLARAMAVVMMVYGHTVDALLAEPYRVGRIYSAWQFQRGLTSCFFLLLSGFAFSITTSRHWQSHLQISPAFVKRVRRFGLFIILGYALHFPVRHFSDLPSASAELWRYFLTCDVLLLIGVAFISVQLLVLVTRTRARFTIAAFAIATLLVAATPLEGSPTIDTWHGFFAGVGYITLAATPLVAARPLARQGHRALSRAGMLAGLISVSSLLLTTTSLPTGVFQRIGLTTTDLWIALSAVAIVTNRISLVRA